MHGIGNDFILLDATQGLPAMGWSPAFVRAICSRHSSIGADGVLLVKNPSDSKAKVKMEIYNSDGSQAEMCGNGIRCVALYCKKYFQGLENRFTIETLAGFKEVQIQSNQKSVLVNMGPPLLQAGFSGESALLKLQDHEPLAFYEVNMGNPHAVLFVSHLEHYPVEHIGPLIERHRRFPHRTNVEFVEIINEFEIRLRVWERGAGETLACGTGACAAAVAAIQTGKLKSPVTVQLNGGDLRVEWTGEDKAVLMQGDAQEVYEGYLEIC